MKYWQKACKVNKGKPLPTDLESIKDYIKAGESKKRALKKAKQAEEIKQRLE